jgi:GAF domain-containing protein
LTNASSGVIYRIYQNTNQTFRLGGVYNHPTEIEHPLPRLDQNDSVTLELIRKQEIQQFSGEFNNEDRIRPELRDQGVKAVIGAPLIHDSKVIGVIYLNSTTKTCFNPVEEFSLRTFAAQAANAIYKAELLELFSSQKNAQEKLVKASQAILENDRLIDTFQEIVKSACDLLNAQYSHLALLEYRTDHQEVLVFKAAYPPNYLKKLQRKVGIIDLETGSNQEKYRGKLGIAGLTVKNQRHYLIRVNDDLEMQQDEEDEVRKHFIDFISETQSELAVPIKDGQGRVIGIINVEHRESHGLTEAHIDIMRSFAAQVALALQKNQLLADAQQSANQLEGLYEASTKLIATSSERIH